MDQAAASSTPAQDDAEGYTSIEMDQAFLQAFLEFSADMGSDAAAEFMDQFMNETGLGEAMKKICEDRTSKGPTQNMKKLQERLLKAAECTPPGIEKDKFNDLARRAGENEFDDFSLKHCAPLIVLCIELADMNSVIAKEIRKEVEDGVYDADDVE